MNKTIGELKKNNTDNEELQNAVKKHEDIIKQMKVEEVAARFAEMEK